MRNLYQIILFAMLTYASACDSSEEGNPEMPQTIIDQSLELFSGSVVDSGLEEEEGLNLWKVKIANGNGAAVSFYWTVSGQAFFKMEADAGPFDYDIWPGDNFINFSTAKTVAIEGVKNSNITAWELAREAEFNDLWVYTFEFDVRKVYVDAENGNILEID